MLRSDLAFLLNINQYRGREEMAMKKMGKKVKLEKKSLQAYAFCVCTNCPCPSGVNSYTVKYNDSENRAK